MSYNQPTPGTIEKFEAILGNQGVIIDREQLESYAHDETEDLKFFPRVVVKPANKNEIAAIVKICYEESIPITP